MAQRGLSSHRRKRRQRRIRRFVGFLFLFVVVYLIVTSSVLEPVRVSDDAMAPGIVEGDLLLSSPLLLRIPRIRPIRRGDLVLLENPGSREISFGGHLWRRALAFVGLTRRLAPETGGSALLLRRVLGLPGERIMMEGYRLLLRTDDNRWIPERELLPDGYERILPAGEAGGPTWPAINSPGSPDSPAMTLSEVDYYLLADNRGGPMDSRLWGPLHRRRLHGRVFFRILPLSRFGPLGTE